ncbi:MAG: hypothetical protein KIS81_09300 [Maricaulaceae bacterium]|nr:hypothetical protein [Maricaulaceae bacterium]
MAIISIGIPEPIGDSSFTAHVLLEIDGVKIIDRGIHGVDAMQAIELALKLCREFSFVSLRG